MSSLGALGTYVRSRGLKDGFLRGNRFWTVAGAVFWAVRLLSKMASRKPELVARELLEPGQSITITSVEKASA